VDKKTGGKVNPEEGGLDPGFKKCLTQTPLGHGANKKDQCTHRREVIVAVWRTFREFRFEKQALPPSESAEAGGHRESTWFAPICGSGDARKRRKVPEGGKQQWMKVCAHRNVHLMQKDSSIGQRATTRFV